MKPIAAAFALIGLYYALEHGFDGRQVQRVHSLLARRKFKWLPLEPPEKAYSITVCHVLDAPPEKRDVMLRRWMLDVWDCWSHRHKWVRETCSALLDNY